mgnify:FL=1
MKKVAIMQPYLFPYLGYWQLIKAVDQFVLLDDVQYINRGWINRNRILLNGRDHLFSFSVRKASQQTAINQRYFSSDFLLERTKFLRSLHCAYGKAPFFAPVYDVIEKSLTFPPDNLARNIGQNMKGLAEYLGIATPIVFSSDIVCNKALKAQEYILELNRQLAGEVYINLSGGVSLYDRDEFRRNGIQLQFIRADEVEYRQFGQPFVPNLSVIDVMMFNSRDEINTLLDRYTLI